MDWETSPDVLSAQGEKIRFEFIAEFDWIVLST